MAAVPSGSSIISIGWTIHANAATASGAANLNIYLQNTSDTGYSKGTSYSAALSGMTTVHSASTTLSTAVAPFEITFTGGSPFVYTGGALYVAYDWGHY